MNIRDRRLTTVIAVVGSAVLLTASGFAIAATTTSSDVYSGCLDHKTHTLYKVGINARTAPKCRTGDKRVKWNSRGPQGAQGVRGLQGTQGPPGPTSLAALQGTACTTAEGVPGTVAVTIDSDNSVAMGCHSNAVVPIVLTTKSAQALAQRMFERAAVELVTVTPDCANQPTLACPSGTPSNPPPTISADETMHPGDTPHIDSASADTSSFAVAGRIRLATNADIPVDFTPSVSCNLKVDTAGGSQPDAALQFSDVVPANATSGPTQVQNFQVSLEAADFSLTGPGICPAMSFTVSQANSIVARAVEPWVQSLAVVCGRVAPDYFHACP